MFTVQVFYKSNGKPAQNQKVSCSFDGFFGGVTKEQYSDEIGETHFDYEPRRGVIYVNGKTEYTGNIAGRMIVYI